MSVIDLSIEVSLCGAVSHSFLPRFREAESFLVWENNMALSFSVRGMHFWLMAQQAQLRLFTFGSEPGIHSWFFGIGVGVGWLGGEELKDLLMCN